LSRTRPKGGSTAKVGGIRLRTVGQSASACKAGGPRAARIVAVKRSRGVGEYGGDAVKPHAEDLEITILVGCDFVLASLAVVIVSEVLYMEQWSRRRSAH
jgi:hypothetical protein